MNCRKATSPIVFFLFAFILVVFSACSEDSKNGVGPGPGPHEGTDSVVFFVYTTEPGGDEVLRWIGDGDGPHADSPEGTSVPWIGYGRAFRISWRADAADFPVSGYQYRRSQIFGARFFPQDATGQSIWGTDSTVVFTNSVDPATISPNDCEEGRDCPENRRWESGTHSFELLVRNGEGRVLAPELGLLQFRVNYPPEVEFDFDRSGSPSDPLASPVWSIRRNDGSTHIAFLSEGDTIPSGATVQFLMDGRDRLLGRGFPDSFCCDLRLDPDNPEVRYQSRLEMIRVSSNDVVDTLETQYTASSSPDSLQQLQVGPFAYNVIVRGRDEHGGRSDTRSFSFVGGAAPLAPAILPADGARGLLHDPFTDQPIAENEIPYGIQNTFRYWDAVFAEWSESEPGTFYPGVLYTIPIRFESAPNSAITDFVLAYPGEYGDDVRSFDYVCVSEHDPANLYTNGDGDRRGFFLSTTSPNTLALEGTEAYQIFVPMAFLADPDSFDPDDPLTEPEKAEVGARIRVDLGKIALTARARTVDFGATIDQPLPHGRGEIPETVEYSLDFHGRMSPEGVSNFEIYIGFNDGAGNYTLWPTPTP